MTSTPYTHSDCKRIHYGCRIARFWTKIADYDVTTRQAINSKTYKDKLSILLIDPVR